MKKNIWTYFINITSGGVAVFGLATMAATYELYDNFMLSIDKYELIQAYNEDYKDNEISQEIESSFSKLLEIRYNFQNQNLTKINLELFRTFATHEDYVNFLKDKDKSYIYDSLAMKDIEKNTNSMEFKNELITLESLAKKENSNFANKLIDSIDKGFINATYIYNKTPEYISFTSGIVLLITSLLVIMAYWIYCILKKNKTS